MEEEEGEDARVLGGNKSSTAATWESLLFVVKPRVELTHCSVNESSKFTTC